MIDNTKHTPGPWKYGVRKNKTIWLSIPEVTPTLFEERKEHHQFDLPAGEANARLISTAPDLLEALAELVEAVKSDLDIDSFFMDRAIEAIERATGREVCKLHGVIMDENYICESCEIYDPDDTTEY